MTKNFTINVAMSADLDIVFLKKRLVNLGVSFLF